MITNPQKKALIIGISDYTNLEQLDFCKNDGMEVYNVLSSQGYDISDKNKLVGEVNWENVRNTIYDFFGDIESNPDDTLLFYYSGHGVLDDDGEIYLASSDIDPDEPYRKGFSFEELTRMVRKSVPIGVVVILDCCYSGSAKIGKGSQEDAARRGRITVEEKSRKFSEVQGKYILSASQASQEAYALKEEDHSIYTSYLLKGLRGKSIDGDGNVTPPSLHNYVYREIMSLPHNRRPRQRPGIQGSGIIVLVSYPNLRTPLPVSPTMSIPNNPPTKSSEAEVHREILGSKSKILMVVLATVIVIALALLTYYNHPPVPNNNSTTITAQAQATALYNKGAVLINLGNYTGAIKYFDKALVIDPTYENALVDKGLALHNLGNYTQALHYFDKALAIDPNDELSLGLKGGTLGYLGNYTGAIIFLNKALDIDPRDEYALNGKGLVLNSLGNYTGAIIFLNKALDIDPNYKYALNDKGWALIGLGNYTGAIKSLDRALAIDPNYKWALSNKGAALSNLGNYTGAIKYYDKALVIDPNFEKALKGKGIALNDLGKYTQAIHYFNKALALDPNDTDTLNEKGWAVNRLGNHTVAINTSRMH